MTQGAVCAYGEGNAGCVCVSLWCVCVSLWCKSQRQLALCGHWMHLGYVHEQRQTDNFIAPGCMLSILSYLRWAPFCGQLSAVRFVVLFVVQQFGHSKIADLQSENCSIHTRKRSSNDAKDEKL